MLLQTIDLRALGGISSSVSLRKPNGRGKTTIEAQNISAAEALGVRVSGELDMQTSPALEQALAAGVEAGGPVLVDLSGVTFMDSTAIHVLIRTAQQLLGQGCVIVHGEPPHIARVLDIAALERQFDNFHRVSENGSPEARS